MIWLLHHLTTHPNKHEGTTCDHSFGVQCKLKVSKTNFNNVVKTILALFQFINLINAVKSMHLGQTRKS